MQFIVIRINIKNKENKTLAGDLYKTGSDTIIIISHGFVSDRHADGKFDVASKLLSENGFDVLTFDYSGCGESNKSPISIRRWINDLGAVIKYVKKLKYIKIGILGSSVGSYIALKHRSDCLVLLAPVTSKGTPNMDSEQLKKIKSRGYYLYKRKDNNKVFKIDKSYFYDRQKINQKEILEKVQCPTLIIQGTNDKFIRMQDSINAVKYLKNGRINIIKGGTHKFKEHLDIVLKYTLDWFKNNLK